MLEDVFNKQGIDSGEAERVLVSAFCSGSREMGYMNCIHGSHWELKNRRAFFSQGKVGGF